MTGTDRSRTPANMRPSKTITRALSHGKGFDSCRPRALLLVEQQFYEEVEKGTVRNADDIEALTQKTEARFSIWFGPQSELPMEWTNANLYYVWPMYRLNYLYSKLLAIKYFDVYTRDPSRFVKSYQGLLRNGYDATPDVLLEKFIGTNTRDPKLVNDALEVITHKTDELEQLYASAGQFQIKPGREQR